MKLSIILFFPVLGACSLLSLTDSVVLEAPLEGLPWADESGPERWNISWLGDGGKEHSCTLDRREFGRFRLEIPRERAVVVLAEPGDATALLPFSCTPAGVVLSPGDARPDVLKLNWEDGFAAQLLMSLARRGIAVEALNLRRLTELCITRSNADPWALDIRRLVDNLLSGDLWVYSFRLRDEVDTVLNFPVSGLWFSEYPLSQPIEVVSGSWSGPLYTGLHRFCMGAQGPVAEAYIDERGRATMFFIE